MNNLKDFSKICRVCMSDGSRDIFFKTAPSPTPTAGNHPTPLDRLLEKLRYVTMMKIDENDDLPRLLCDLCIVQLNVAYHFKRIAVENDTKLRQYFIENGVSSLTPTINTINNLNCSSSSNCSENMQISPSLRNTLNTNINNLPPSRPMTPSSSKVVSSNLVNKKPFPVLPVVIKTEPEDKCTEENEKIINIPTNNIQYLSNLNNTNVSSMVYINGYDYNNVTPSSEIESLSPNCGVNLQSSPNLSASSATNLIDAHTLPTSLQHETQNKPNNTKLSKSIIKKRQVPREVQKLDLNVILPGTKTRTQSELNKRPSISKNSLRNKVKPDVIHKKNLKNDSVNSDQIKSGIQKKLSTNSKKVEKPVKISDKTDTIEKNSPTRLLINPCSPKSSSSIIKENELQVEQQSDLEKKQKKRKFIDEGRVKTKIVPKLLKLKVEPEDK